MKPQQRLDFVAAIAVLCLLSCSKEQKEVSGPATAPGFQPVHYYFDTRGGWQNIPKKFASFPEALAYFKSHFPLLDNPASQKQLPVVTVLDDSNDPPAVTSYDPGVSGDVTAPYIEWASADDLLNKGASFCPAWQTGYFDEWNANSQFGPESVSPGAALLPEDIEASYAARGIICVINFGVKYAPTPIGSTPGYAYALASEITPKLVITGGALGTLAPDATQVDIGVSGAGLIFSSDVETRTQVFTSTNKFEFKAGDSKNYPVGTVLEDGSTVMTSVNSVTRYLFSYGLQFYSTPSSHFHLNLGDDPICYYENPSQDGSGGMPIMSYTDIGSSITGVPQN